MYYPQYNQPNEALTLVGPLSPIAAMTALRRTMVIVARDILSGELELTRMPETVEETIEMMRELVLDDIHPTLLSIYHDAMTEDIETVIRGWVNGRSLAPSEGEGHNGHRTSA